MQLTCLLQNKHEERNLWILLTVDFSTKKSQSLLLIEVFDVITSVFYFKTEIWMRLRRPFESNIICKFFAWVNFSVQQCFCFKKNRLLYYSLSNWQDITEENKSHPCPTEWLFRVDIVIKWKESSTVSVLLRFLENIKMSDTALLGRRALYLSQYTLFWIFWRFLCEKKEYNSFGSMEISSEVQWESVEGWNHHKTVSKFISFWQKLCLNQE